MKNIQVTIDICPIGPLAVKCDVNRPNQPAGSIKVNPFWKTIYLNSTDNYSNK